MTRSLAGVLLIACWCLALCAGGAMAEIPSGPRLTFMVMGDAGFKMVSSNPEGGDRRIILGGSTKSRFLPFPLSRPSWSGDGTRVVFTGMEESGDDALLDVYAVAADGSGLTKLPGTRNGLSAVLSPDGRTLAFARERDGEVREHPSGKLTVVRTASTWLLDIGSGSVRQLTPWKLGLSTYPSSFSPDGSTLAVSRKWGDRRSAVAIRLDGSGKTVLARNAAEPVFSPDGTKVVLTTSDKRRTIGRKGETLTYTPTDLAVAAADGSGLVKLTRTRNVELAPSWDPSGQRIAYVLYSPVLDHESLFLEGDSIMEVNADGSCRTKVLSVPKVTLFGATWQPGPGREAGPISC